MLNIAKKCNSVIADVVVVVAVAVPERRFHA